jgi:4-hydroxy-3-methylbut-2-en-1-yl diphosphate synthase IspG/GcpE
MNEGAIDYDTIELTAFGILQAARLRTTRTEYISCPGCGRTLYDLRETIARIKEATTELKRTENRHHGCIVNGPGEMADADYGYVGAGPKKCRSYRGQECVEKNIPRKKPWRTCSSSSETTRRKPHSNNFIHSRVIPTDGVARDIIHLSPSQHGDFIH